MTSQLYKIKTVHIAKSDFVFFLICINGQQHTPTTRESVTPKRLYPVLL